MFIYRKARDSVWMYDQVHHRLLLDHHQLVTEFAIPGKDILYRIVMGKKRYYGLSPHTLYELRPASNNSFITSPFIPIRYRKSRLIVLLIDKNENPILIGTSVTVVLAGT